jgi:hypothetical protein
MDDLNVLYTPADMARRLGVSLNALHKARTVSPENHPPSIRLGRSVRYPAGAFKMWLDAKLTGGVDLRSARDKDEGVRP